MRRAFVFFFSLSVFTGAGCGTKDKVQLPPPRKQPARTASREFYYTRLVTGADLKNRTLRELSLMRNWIYARTGHKFRKKWLRGFFQKQSWYKPVPEPNESKLTATDRKNAEMIGNYEASLPEKELLRRKDAVLARAKAGTGTENDELELSLLSIRLGKWYGEAKDSAKVPSPLEDPSLLEKLLNVKQLENLSRRDLSILRNTVYARRGRPFQSKDLRDYFSGTVWYKPAPSYSDALLTKIDRKNIKIIYSVEAQLGGPLSEKGRLFAVA